MARKKYTRYHVGDIVNRNKILEGFHMAVEVRKLAEDILFKPSYSKERTNYQINFKGETSWQTSHYQTKRLTKK